eukprot:COSAG05_NODE_296_length_11959_cov_17.897639_6_plen_45_part_00
MNHVWLDYCVEAKGKAYEAVARISGRLVEYSPQAPARAWSMRQG